MKADCRPRDNGVNFAALKTFFAGIPYDIHIKREKYYQSLFYTLFALIGTQIEAEVRTNEGRIDSVIKTAENIYLFEFKLNGSAQDAIDQIIAKKYPQKYKDDSRKKVLIGVNFALKKGQICDWIVN